MTQNKIFFSCSPSDVWSQQQVTEATTLLATPKQESGFVLVTCVTGPDCNYPDLPEDSQTADIDGRIANARVFLSHCGQ